MKKKKKRVLVIVAHPDDETIWMGGTIIKNTVIKKNWKLTILCLCRKHDKDRAPRFKKVCKFYKAKCKISDLEDEHLGNKEIPEAIKRIKKYAKKKYDIIFTHNKNGEYGHIRHIDAHYAVKRLLKEQRLIAKKVLFFSYKKFSKKNTDTGFNSYAYKSADKFIKLKRNEILLKKKMITKIYSFPVNSFEERNASIFEAFEKYKK
ncbi:hypothetical protein GOV12_04010 [Candidatus Pacearchaeota archaeon]|nr:hypothetical protein [Candidatus Pacearchaeota archaeon]